MSNAVVIDVNNIVYRALAIKNYLSFRGKSTTGFYGFLEQFFSYVNLYKPEYIICTLDKKPYKRSEIFPDYKMDRVKSTFDPVKSAVISEGVTYIRDFLDLCDIQLWEVSGLEADDLIAIACTKLTALVDKVIIMSNDDDLYQLLSNEKVFLHTKRKGLYGKQEFEQEYKGITPKDWIKILALKGTHNGIKGVVGIGEKGALKIIQGGRWDEFRKTPSIQRDLHLVELPIEFIDLPVTKHKVVARNLFNYLIRTYGINVEPYMDKAIQFLERGNHERFI